MQGLHIKVSRRGTDLHVMAHFEEAAKKYPNSAEAIMAVIRFRYKKIFVQHIVTHAEYNQSR